MKKHLILMVFVFFSLVALETTAENPLTGIRITIDPGHGFSAEYDSFRVGPTGEREEWINLRVANLLAKKLKKAGAIVLMTRNTDRDISLGGRAGLAKTHKSDFLVAIHHNGSSDRNLDFPIVYIWGSAIENPASVDLAKCLVSQMKKDMTFEQQNEGAVYSDFLIYPQGTSILRNTVEDLPAIIGEGGFFTCAKAETRMKNKDHNELEAETYYQSILAYVSRGLPKTTLLKKEIQKGFKPGMSVQFVLTDGLSNHKFQASSISVLQDDQKIAFKYNEKTGLLTAIPMLTDQKAFSLRIFGRNTKGNALHPKRWHFTTQLGEDWIIVKSWREAFEKAEPIMLKLNRTTSPLPKPEMKEALEKCIHLFQLSLELQPANPKARSCEEGLLKCYQMQKNILKIDTAHLIESQKKRLADFYP